MILLPLPAPACLAVSCDRRPASWNGTPMVLPVMSWAKTLPSYRVDHDSVAHYHTPLVLRVSCDRRPGQLERNTNGVARDVMGRRPCRSFTMTRILLPITNTPLVCGLAATADSSNLEDQFIVSFAIAIWQGFVLCPKRDQSESSSLRAFQCRCDRHRVRKETADRLHSEHL